jgi:hypothetical protein
MTTVAQILHQNDETYLIEHFAEHRKIVEPHILLLADRIRSPWIQLCRQHGVRSYVALSQRHLNSALRQGRITSKVLTPLALGVLSTVWFLDGVKDIPLVWRVTPQYVFDLVRLMQKGPSPMSMEDIYRYSLEHIQEEVRAAALSGATFLRQVCDGTIPVPDAVRAKYSSLALARVGFGPIVKSLPPMQPQVLSREEIEVIKLRATDAALEVQSSYKTITGDSTTC